jgi:hypothetical protein
MGIISFVANTTGQVNVNPRRVKVITTDNLATITTAGYLNKSVISADPIYPTDIFDIDYSYVASSQTYTYGEFTPSFSNGVITLVATASSGITLPTIANHIATYTNTSGQLGEDAATAINGGNIQAGLSGTAGKLTSFPGTAASGSLSLTAVNSAGNFAGVISNASLGQASTWSLADPGGATSNIAQAPSALVSGNLVKASGTAGLLVDAAFALHAATTASYAGGGTSNAFVTTNMTASSIVTAVILTSTNPVSIVKAVPGTNTLTVTFSADPGAATTVSWISVTPAG